MPGASAKRPELEVCWTSQAQQDREFWGKHNRRASARIEKLIADIQERPFIGIGKPEPLRYEWSPITGVGTNHQLPITGVGTSHGL